MSAPRDAAADLAPEHGPDGIDSLDHVALTVRDMDRAIAFYRDALGCTVLGQLVNPERTFKLVYLRKGRAYLELFAHKALPGRPVPEAPTLTDRTPGFQHVAFHVDDVDAVAARLERAGAVFTQEPMDAAGDVRLAFFRDPDGNLLEIVSNLPTMEAYRPGWA